MDRLLNNTNFVRVVALLLGVLLWLVVRLNYEQINVRPNNPVLQTDTIVDAKVTPVGLDTEQYYLSSIEPEGVDVHVQGTSSALNRIPNSQYAIIADLTGLTEGIHEVELTALNFPRGVEVTLDPDVVTVTIERMETKQFDVIIELIGTPAEGLKAGVPVANPSRVHATVPASRLDAIHSIRGKIDIHGAAETIVREVKLEAYDASGKLLEDVAISPSIVSVEVPITPPIRSVPLQVSYIGRPPQGLSVAGVSQDVEFVTITGPQEVIDAIDFYEGVVVDLSRITADQTLTLKIPLMNQITSVEPGEVRVTIDVEPTVQRTFEAVPIRLFGEQGDYEIAITSPESGTISLTVEGAEALVNRLTAGDVQVILDVSNIAPGSYVLPLRVNLPRFIELAAADELRVSVTVTEASEQTSGPVNEEPEPDVTQPEQPPEEGRTYDPGSDGGGNQDIGNQPSEETTDDETTAGEPGSTANTG